MRCSAPLYLSGFRLRQHGTLSFLLVVFRPAGAKKQPTKDENPRYA
jgi:hypothetical protein